MNISELRIVFVGGIHGVGKSHFSNKVSRLLGVPILSASKLITHQQKRPAAIQKRVLDIPGNQDALIAAIEARPTVNGKFILDGHFCVLDSSDKIQKIQIETFQKLSPAAVVVLADNIDQIQKRLKIRDKRIFKKGMLNSLQEAELEHAKKVCNHLAIPMCLMSVAQWRGIHISQNESASLSFRSIRNITPNFCRIRFSERNRQRILLRIGQTEMRFERFIFLVQLNGI